MQNFPMKKEKNPAGYVPAPTIRKPLASQVRQILKSCVKTYTNQPCYSRIHELPTHTDDTVMARYALQCASQRISIDCTITINV